MSTDLTPEAQAWVKQFDGLSLENKIETLENIRKTTPDLNVKKQVLTLLVDAYQKKMEAAYQELRTL